MRSFVSLLLVFSTSCDRNSDGGGGFPDANRGGHPDASISGQPDGSFFDSDAPITSSIDGGTTSDCPAGCPTGYSCGTANGIAVCRDDATGIPLFKHIFVIPFENMTLSSLQGYMTDSSGNAAPYLTSLMSTYAWASDYHGVTHPSLPNYIAMTSGQYNDPAPAVNGTIDCDCDPSGNGNDCSGFLTCDLVFHGCDCPETGIPNVANSFDTAGVSWMAFAEDMGTACNQASSGTYAARHVPFVYFPTLASDCPTHVVDYSNFLSIFQSSTPQFAQFNFLTPNLTDDMHDPALTGGAGNATNGDEWLAGLPIGSDTTHPSRFTELLKLPAYTDGGLVVLVWDEDDNSGGITGSDDPVPFVLLSPYAKSGGFVSTVTANHYSLLKTIEIGLDVAPVGGSDALAASPLTDFFPTI